MYVIAGLGNPGKNYEGTKHNIGFEVIDALAKAYDIDVTKFKHKALMGDGIIEGQRVLLVKPQTYMNLSGESIREILQFYKVPVDHFLVIYDDISLPPGSTRMREKGSAGGHNGIKNIISHFGNDIFLRIKIGVGEKPNGWDLADFVLSHFSKDDAPMMVTGIERALKGIKLWLQSGVKDAMNATNQQPPKPKKEEPPKEITEKRNEEKNQAQKA